MNQPHRTLSHLCTATLVALSLATACDKGGANGEAKGEAASDKSGGPSAKAGKVTVERLEALDNSKVTNEAADYDKCVAAAEAQLGKASKVEGDEYTWSAVKGEECHSYVLMGADGMMSRSKGPYKVGASELEECKKTAG